MQIQKNSCYEKQMQKQDGHLRFDLGGFLLDAGPFAELHGREQQPHFPEHPRAAPLSRQHNAAVHLHGVVLQRRTGV